jgi:aspartate/tyrosine/aromatic aminotransferase
MEETVITDADLLRRIDQMAMELERLRQQLLESMAAKGKRKKFKSVREYEACGMWADREEWQGLSAEEVLERIREKAWGRTYSQHEA